jgi:Kef-type K+ transport system membrane component KefB
MVMIRDDVIIVIIIIIIISSSSSSSSSSISIIIINNIIIIIITTHQPHVGPHHEGREADHPRDRDVELAQALPCKHTD